MELIDKWATLDTIGMKISLSKLGVTSSTSSTMTLEKLYEKISLNFHSMMSLSRNVPLNEIDINTLASCARNIMESTKVFYYFSTAFSNKELFEFRHMLYCLNDNRNTDDIFKKLCVEEPDVLGMGNWGSQALVFYMKDNRYFQSLSAGDKEYALKGGKRFYGMESPKIIDSGIESACYNLFSNSIHSLYGGISSNSLNPSLFNSKIDSVFLFYMAFEVSGLYYAHVAKDYLKKRYRLRRYLDVDERESIEKYAKDTSLMRCIEYFRGEKSKYSL